MKNERVFYYFQQLSGRHYQQFHPILYQLPRIHKFLLVFPPVSHAALFRHERRWPTLIRIHEIHNLTPFCSPFLILRHTSKIIIIFWPSLRHKTKKSKKTRPSHHSYDFHTLFLFNIHQFPLTFQLARSSKSN